MTSKEGGGSGLLTGLIIAGVGVAAVYALSGSSSAQARPLVSVDKSLASWPPLPPFGPLVDKSILGDLQYRAAPVVGNLEAIVITNDWATKNIVTVEIPQLKGVLTSGRIPFHKDGVEQLKAMWAAWEAAGLLPLVLNFVGTFRTR